MSELNLNTLAPAEQALLAGLLAKLQPNPTEPVRKKKRRTTETIKYLTTEELERLFKAIESPRDRAIFHLAYHRGLRAGELGRIQVSDLRLKEDRIQIERLKGSSGGEYHLCASEVRALRAWLKVRGDAPGALFLSRCGKGISQQMLDVLIKRYGEKAGVPAEKRHMHALKHSCATHLLDRGESIEDVQDHLGHRNIASTQIYAKFTNQRRQARDRRLRDW